MSNTKVSCTTNVLKLRDLMAQYLKAGANLRYPLKKRSNIKAAVRVSRGTSVCSVDATVVRTVKSLKTRANLRWTFMNMDWHGEAIRGSTV